MPREFRQQVANIGIRDHRMVLAAEVLSHDASVLQLVESALRKSD